MAQQLPPPASQPVHINTNGSDVDILCEDHFIDEEDGDAACRPHPRAGLFAVRQAI